MKNSTVIFLFFVVAFSQFSCTSPKDIIMFQDLRQELELYDVPNHLTEHKIRPFDNLYLSILTLDPEVNKLFNPSLEGDGYNPGTQQMYGDKTSQFINGYRVSEDGTINLPILGEINFLGLTLEEAEKHLKAKAEEYLKKPTVQVKLLNFKVNVSGEVTVPGLYYNYEGRLNIIDAISMANGVTQYADIKNIIVIRQTRRSTKSFKLNFTDRSVYSSDVFYLQPNDIVYIPPNKFKRQMEYNSTYSLILSTISTVLVALTLFIKT